MLTDPECVRDLRFSQWCCWGFRFSGTWCCVVGWVGECASGSQFFEGL